MALRNRNLQEENKLRGADRSRDSTKFKLGQFRTLENWIPAHVYSIKKKRGVELLESIPSSPVTPLPCEGGSCTDASERGQQIISIEDRFDQVTSFPPNGNLRTSWGYISPTEEVWTLIGEASCAGGNMAYVDACCQLNRFQTPSILTHPALIDPNGLLPAVNTLMGTSDEPIYGVQTSGPNFYYPDSLTHVVYAPGVNLYPTFSDGEGIFAKAGSQFFMYSHRAGDLPNGKRILEFDAIAGTQLNEYDTIEDFNIGQMACTSQYLYCLCTEIGNANGQAIKKLSRADGSVVDTFHIDNISPNAIGVVNDNLIYILCNGSPASVYYLKDFSTLIYIGYTTGQGITPFSFIHGSFVNGAMYYGNNGFGGFTTDIFKISIECPVEAPLIATVNRDANTVADGATIVASWADVLVPNASDTIQLHSAPAGSDLGFTASSRINTQPTDGLGTSSIVYTIPGGTPPGSYVFMYAALGGIYVATSPTFTVT